MYCICYSLFCKHIMYYISMMRRTRTHMRLQHVQFYPYNHPEKYRRKGQLCEHSEEVEELGLSEVEEGHTTCWPYYNMAVIKS